MRPMKATLGKGIGKFLVLVPLGKALVVFRRSRFDAPAKVFIVR